MISTIISDYSWYWPVICFVSALAATAVSYYHNKRLSDFNPWKIRLLSSLRFTALFLVALLLLNIFVRSTMQRTEKPILAIAIDNSESMTMRGPQKDDSLKLFRSQLKQMAENLEDKYNVRFFAFGDKLAPCDIDAMNFPDKYTDISQMMQSMQGTLYNTNTGALVVCSDGIYNRGQNPLYQAQMLGKRIYTVTLGDTSACRDIAVTKVVYNETTFLGNEFPLQITMQARMLAGAKTLCEVRRNGKVEFSQNITINSDNFTQEISTTLKAQQKGIQKYTISFVPQDGEITESNNTRDIMVEVVDDKHKVLILSSMPHPDVAAIRSALSQNRGLELEVATADNFSKSVAGYNLVILVQLPSVNVQSGSILSEIKTKNIPVLYVLGTTTDFNQLNGINNCIQINKKSDSFEEVSYTENARFSLFSFENGVEEMLQKAPPLYCAFGEYSILPQTQVFGNQLLKGVATDKPLIAVSDPSKSRSAVIAGEGIWRWRIDCYKRYSNHEKFDLLISRLCQFLITRTDRERFTITTRTMFSENEPAFFNAKVLNELLEPDRDAEVIIEVSADGNIKSTYRMETSGNGYYLRIDNLEPGAYTYTAKAVSGGKTFTKNGIFSVSEIKTEAENLIANSNIMSKIASQTGGGAYGPGDIEALGKALLDNESIRPVVYSDTTTAPLLSFKWMFVLIVLLLSAEWFLRKYWGTI